MITVKVRDNSIVVRGHAGMAPVGQDIVCAAVSALTLTLINGLRAVAGMDISVDSHDGFASIRWEQATEIGKSLIDTWYLGICDIVQDYKGYIQIV